MKSGTIESIFRQIKKQSGYEFFYNTAVLDVKEIVGHSERDVGGYFEPGAGE